MGKDTKVSKFAIIFISIFTLSLVGLSSKKEICAVWLFSSGIILFEYTFFKLSEKNDITNWGIGSISAGLILISLKFNIIGYVFLGIGVFLILLGYLQKSPQKQKKDKKGQHFIISKKEKADKEKKERRRSAIKGVWSTIMLYSAAGIFFLGFFMLAFLGAKGLAICWIVCVIVFCTYSLIKYKHTEYVNEEANFKQCIISLIGVIIKADHDIKFSELEKARFTIKRYFKTEEEQKNAYSRVEFAVKSQSDYNLKEICEDINKHMNYSAKSELIMELLAVIYADNEIHEIEDLIIRSVAKNLKISDQEYRSIYAIFMQKYNHGYYNDNHPQQWSEAENQEDNNTNNNSKSSHQTAEMTTSDAYDILGVEEKASDEEVKKAYRAMAIKCHPDNAAMLGEEAVRQATETMKQINAAWEMVKTERKMK